MLPDKNKIKKASLVLYQYIPEKITCSFEELQMYSKLDNVLLCTALLELIQDRKISQKSFSGKVSYSALN